MIHWLQDADNKTFYAFQLTIKCTSSCPFLSSEDLWLTTILILQVNTHVWLANMKLYLSLIGWLVDTKLSWFFTGEDGEESATDIAEDGEMTNLNHTMALLPRLHEVSNIKQGSKKIKNADLNRLGKSGFVITCNISCNGWPYKHCRVK